jgi:PKD repeat protein
MNAVCMVIKTVGGGSGGSAPVADFLVDNYAPNIGDTIQLTDESSNSPTTWAWYVNDVLFSNDQNPTYYCGSPGFLRFVLTVTNSFGGNTSATQTVEVQNGGIQP